MPELNYIHELTVQCLLLFLDQKYLLFVMTSSVFTIWVLFVRNRDVCFNPIENASSLFQEALQDLNEQLEETHNQTEQEMREEIDMKENTVREVISTFLPKIGQYVYRDRS